ncbi:MAG: phage tail protein [Bacteroidota bacterium]
MATEWYPAVNFYFDVTFSGISNEGDTKFMEVSGLEMTLETKPFKEGGSQHTYFLPVKTKFKHLVLKRGFYKDSELIQWCKDTFQSYKIDLKDVTIKLLDEKGIPIATWTAINAYPVKWNMSNFNSNKNEIAIETLELAFETLIRQ